MTVDPSFWRGKRVFLTGHTGFKGGWLALWLKRLGAQVSGYALAPEAGGFHELADVRQVLQADWTADVRDAPALLDALITAQPEVVFHLAAQPLVRASYADPLGTFATNVMGTANLLDAVRQYGGVRATVVVTTDKCYRDLGPPCRETDALGGHDPYSASKAGAEIVAASYAASYELPLATARAGNVIGGGDISTDRLVPDLLRAIDSGAPVHLRHPDAVRPWQHVLEPLRGYLTLSERLLAGDAEAAQAWNFGPRDEDARTVGEVVAELARRWGDDARTDVQAGDHPHEATWLKLDTSLARQRLSWRPRLDLGSALQLTVDWHRGWLAGADPRALTLEQIASYEALG